MRSGGDLDGSRRLDIGSCRTKSSIIRKSLFLLLLPALIQSGCAGITSLADPPPSIKTQPTNQMVSVGKTATFSVDAVGTHPFLYQWRRDGTAISGATGSSFTTSPTTAADDGQTFTVVVSNKAGTVTSDPATLTVTATDVGPSITSAPASQSIMVGQTATFSMSASGTAPLSYQWSKNGAAIPGATSSTYTTPATTSSDNGAQFTILVSNSVGSITSAAATLTVNAAAVGPSITSQPSSQTVTAGQTATFSVSVSGTAPLNYQWNRNGAVISGATGSSYTTPIETTADNGAQFTVLVGNSAGSIISAAATLTVNAAAVPPAITTQPVSQTVIVGQTAGFSVTASGTAPLAYQWNKNGSAISGATSWTYTTPATTPSDNGSRFTVSVSNGAGNVTSGAAILTVNSSPSITSQPASQTVIAGQAASFTVAASGTGPLSYQWQKNGTVISGINSASYTTPVTTTADTGSRFTVVVSNMAGSTTSNAATLTVNAATLLLSSNITSLGFSNVNTGSNSVLPAILTNSGNSNVTISTVSVSGAGFSASGLSAGTIVSPGQALTLNVTFAPAAAGGVTGSVSVVSDASNSPISIGLSGTGVIPAPPTVTITSPANGATVSGTITVSGTASDSVGISAVQVQIDGGIFSPASGSTSWTFTLNTNALSNAAHTVLAQATNTSGVTASKSITVNVSNSGVTLNVVNFGATGNGSTNDTAAINAAIAALTSGATLLFPCGTYLVTSQLTINISNVTVDGSGCATIHNTGGGTVGFLIGPSNPNYGSAVALTSTASELGTSFTTVSNLGVAAGDYVLLQEGGEDSSQGSTNTGCDTVGCRGELLKVASVSGNTVAVTTALHDTYDPSVNSATAQKLLNPLTGIAVQNITFDGNGGSNTGVVYGFRMVGVSESTISGVTSKNTQGSAIIAYADFNVSWNNITVTGAGSAACGSAVWLQSQGNVTINGMSLSSLNPGAPGSGCLNNGAFGFELIQSANSTVSNLTVDSTGVSGRPFKTGSARWNTWNSVTVKNVITNYNGISIEYYSSHNTFNSCVVSNNGGSGTGTGNAGINSFGNFNQYNTFNNCTVSGNGNVQFLISSFDDLRLGQDSNATINGGTFTGTNSVEPVIEVEGASVYIHNATISGPGSAGIGFNSYGINGCINNNTFVASSGLGSSISSSSSSNIGSGNILNGFSSNLVSGTCTGP